MRVLLAAACALLITIPGSFARAHEVPQRVGVRAFVRPEGRVVRVLVRVPLEAMRDVEFPARTGPQDAVSRGVLLDVSRADSTLHDAARLWVLDALTLQADGQVVSGARLTSVRVSLPSDRSFEAYDDALRHVQGEPLAADVELPIAQAMLDVLIEYPLATTDARLAVALRVANLGIKTTTVLQLVTPDGAVRPFTYTGDAGLVQLEPAWWHAASRFVLEGMRHLFSGIDHLLFLLCLIIPVRRARALVGVVTAFTVAHSITLFASAMGFAPDALWFPPLVEVLIAASIVYMAIENMVGAQLERRWMMAFGFGLIHGFGFSFALRESLQFAGAHLLTALASFNVGIEIAQLLVLAVAAPMLALLFSRVVAERTGAVVGSVLIAHTAWHWMTERFASLQAYTFSWPTLDTSLAIAVIRLTMGLLVVGGAAWALSGVMRRLSTPGIARPRPGTPPASRTPSTSSVLLVWCAMGSGLLGVLAATPRAATAQRTTMSGVYTADQAKKGREVFTGACSGCHTVASHSGAVFATRWQGKPLWEFFDYVNRLMPKSTPGALSEDEYVWVTAYVLKLNGMPASPTRELTGEPSLLKAIRIDTTQAAVSRSSGDAAGSHAR